jgi:hypothetical protein
MDSKNTLQSNGFSSRKMLPSMGSTMTTEYLEDQNIATLQWPSLSLDLNPIENILPFLKR